MIRAGLRRLLVAFGVLAGVTGAGSLAIGLMTGSAGQRSVSVGYMLVGSLVMVLGLAAGLRGWGRNADPGSERLASSAILIGIGVALVLLGIGLDPRSDIV